MKKILNIGLILLMAIHCYSQNKVLKGCIKDATTLAPIKDVNINIEGTSKGSTTNDSGFFSLTVPNKNINLLITHLNYKKQVYSTSSKNLETEILLTPQTKELKEITVNSDPISSITKKLPIYVIDYLLIDDKILLLVYNRKKVSDTRLLFIDHEANILLEKKIDQADALYIDCFEDIYFLNKKEAVKIEIHSSEIAVINSMDREEFEASHKAIDFKINDNIYYHTFHYQNFIMKLHSINLYDDENENRTLISLADSSKIDIFESEYNFFYYAKRAINYGMSVTSVYKNLDVLRNYQWLDWEDIHGRFSPLNVAVLKLKNSICVINAMAATIELYDAEGRILNKVSAGFLNDKNYTGKIITDENGENMYAVYKEKATILLKEVDLLSGNLKSQISIPKFPFIENIKIEGKQLYFLHKKNMNEELKQLYLLRI